MSELILKQFSRTRQTLAKTVENISKEAFEVIPNDFNNNIHWQLGHILVTAELFLFNGQQNLPADYNRFFGNGTKPADWTADVPSVETIMEQLNEQAIRIKNIDVTNFDVKLPQPFIGNETVGELAAMGAFHEALHVGQIHILKKLV